MVFGQPAGLSKEARLYAGAAWLSTSVSRRVLQGQFLRTGYSLFISPKQLVLKLFRDNTHERVGASIAFRNSLLGSR